MRPETTTSHTQTGWAQPKTMRKAFSYFIVSFICLYVLNILTLAILGKSSLTKKIIQDTHTSYREFQWTEDVNLLSDLKLNQNQVRILKEYYADTKADFKYLDVDRFDDEVKEVFAPDKYLHMLMVDRHFGYPVYKVEEAEKINEYYHGYSRTYLWLFLMWVQIDVEFLGIS